MLSLEKCREILSENGKKYSEEEIELIREILSNLGEIEYEIYEKGKRNTESNNILQGLDGRTSPEGLQPS
jgi:hypothetical protein